MSATAGIQKIGTYPQAGASAGVLTAVQANIDVLTALIANPDVAPAQAGGGFLDEMSPAAAAQLRVELAALRASMSV